MDIRYKIVKLRAMYISAHGQEPRSIVLGYLAYEKLDRPKKYIGMTVYIDYDNESRVEVGNLAGVE